MNKYLKNLERIEFVVTLACTGRCKHCSQGDHRSGGGHIDGAAAAEAVRKICREYKIKSLMTFGGEPLLYPDDVFKIHRAAAEAGIPKRQIITNGFFAVDTKRIAEVAERLAESGVNAVLLSADAFHQETIPIEPVKAFAGEVLRRGVNIRTQPAWLVSKEDENAYNLKTREILAEFSDIGVFPADGNIIFPEGNALKYLGEYFGEGEYINPYRQAPEDIRTVSVSPDGGLFGESVYEKDILKILEDYSPEKFAD